MPKKFLWRSSDVDTAMPRVRFPKRDVTNSKNDVTHRGNDVTNHNNNNVRFLSSRELSVPDSPGFVAPVRRAPGLVHHSGLTTHSLHLPPHDDDLDLLGARQEMNHEIYDHFLVTVCLMDGSFSFLWKPACKFMRLNLAKFMYNETADGKVFFDAQRMNLTKILKSKKLLQFHFSTIFAICHQ